MARTNASMEKRDIKWNISFATHGHIIHNNILLGWRDLNRNDYPLRGRRWFGVLGAFGRFSCTRYIYQISCVLHIQFNTFLSWNIQVDNSIAINTHNALSKWRDRSRISHSMANAYSLPHKSFMMHTMRLDRVEFHTWLKSCRTMLVTTSPYRSGIRMFCKCTDRERER